MQKEPKSQAERIFLDAEGKISNVEIAKRVGAHPITVGKWKRQDNWTGKLAEAQAKGSEKRRKSSLRKKGAHDEAFKAYIEAGGDISNKTLAEQVGASASSIASWKAAESWGEKLKDAPEPQAVDIESAELSTEPEPVEEMVDVESPEWPAEPEPVQEMDDEEEMEIDVDVLAYPDHITLLNQQIDEILGRGHLSPAELIAVAEAKEAVLRVVIAYLEVVEMTSEE
jgi:hypothetical protein